MKIPVYQLDRKPPTQTSNDLPRALTEFGQQAEVNPRRRLVLGLAKNQSALALLRLFGRRLLKLNGGNPIRLCRLNRDHSKIPVRVALSNDYCGLFSRRSGNHPAVDQYGHAETRAGIAGINLIHLLLRDLLSSCTGAMSTG
jgi:hypothetical protein